ncbi:MAG: hypothetical protein L0Z62_39460 [Gemmataceae bacterium]|nr:hypothetical protein [Gemmataceae bacterium]
MSLRDLARQHAPDIAGQFQDDQSLAQYLIQQRAQALEIQRQFQQQVLPYWSEFQSYVAQQRAAQQQQSQSGQKPWWSQWWSPPDYDPSWESMVTRDAQGNLVAAPGAPPDVLPRWHAYQHYRRQQLEKLLSNPFTYFEEPIRHLAQQVAEQAVQRTLGSYQDQSFARDFIGQNAQWLYQRDQQGNVVTQPTFDPQSGRTVAEPVLSPAGQAFRNYVLEASQMGIGDVRAQQRYALRLLQADQRGHPVLPVPQQSRMGRAKSNDPQGWARASPSTVPSAWRATLPTAGWSRIPTYTAAVYLGTRAVRGTAARGAGPDAGGEVPTGCAEFEAGFRNGSGSIGLVLTQVDSRSLPTKMIPSCPHPTRATSRNKVRIRPSSP